MKKFIVLLLLSMLVILSVSTGVYADFYDVPSNAPYADALNRMAQLGIMNGFGDGSYGPDLFVTREQFAKTIIVAAGLEGQITPLKGVSIFSDVDPQGWSCAYINYAALQKSYITAMDDGKFHPQDNVTFAQVCIAMIKLLGYNDQDLPGVWPNNYIEKARALGLLEGINLTADDAVPRWALAVMIDALLNTPVKGTSGKTLAESVGLYTECIVLGTSQFMDKLTDRQVLTDKGIFYIKDPNINVEIGCKYGFVIEGDTIIKSYAKSNNINRITVLSVRDTKITYTDGSNTGSMVLPDKTVYYYNGSKVNGYDGLKSIIQVNTSILFAYNKSKTGYDYAIILDPVYSAPQIAVNYKPSDNRVGNIIFQPGVPIVKNGDLITPDKIEDRDVVYLVSDVWNRNKYIQIINTKVEGKITAILPSKLSPKTLQLGNKTYEFSKDMDFAKLSTSADAFKIDDYVIALLGYDGKVVDIVYPGVEDTSNYAFLLNYSQIVPVNAGYSGKTVYTVKLFLADGSTVSYKVDSDPSAYKGKLVKFSKTDSEFITLAQPQSVSDEVNKLFQNAPGLYSEYIILGNSKSMDRLAENQVMTDKGIFYIYDTSVPLELGGKYRLITDGDSIIKVDVKLKSIKSVTVDSVFDNRITFKDQNGVASMTLPEKTVYYYNGSRLSGYDAAKAVLQINTCILFAYNNDMSGYEYAVILDPVYSKPEIALNVSTASRKFGSIDMSNGPSILKNGELIDVTQIKDYDVLYMVTDFWGANGYVLVVDGKVEGKISAILPNRLSPKVIQINGKNYDFAKSMDLKKLAVPGLYKVDDDIIALLGYDGKVVDVIYPGNSDTSAYAIVLNSSKTVSYNIADFGKTIYTVKLLLDTGEVVTYKTNGDVSDYKGSIVAYKKLDDETVELTRLNYLSESSQVNIKKTDRMVNDSCVTENVKIFNLIVNTTGEVQARLVNWNDMPEGIVQAGKLLYYNKVGEFGDINVMLFEDLFDEKYRLATVKDASLKSGRMVYTLLINGIEYTYSPYYIVSGADIGTVMKVNMMNNTVSSVVELAKPVCESTKVQAIDTKRIKINDRVYLFKNNISIYMKHIDGSLTMIGTNDISTDKSYGKVSIYLDKPYESGGKVETIVISEY